MTGPEPLISELIIKRPGEAAMRVRLVRIDNQRRMRLARKLRRMGWPLFAIRQACLFSPAAVDRALREDVRGIWGRHCLAIAQEMERLA